MNQTNKIYVAGHNGIVGSAIIRLLEKRGFDNLILKSSIVILAAARVGGIQANIDHPAEFLYGKY